MNRRARLFLSIATTTIVMLCSTAPASGATASPSAWQLDSYCRGCHTTLHNQWKTSMHAQAFEDEIYQKTLNLAVTDLGGPGNADAKALQVFCLSCHVPIGKLANDLPPTTASSATAISCDFCHTVSGTTGIGNASFINTPGDVKRGPYFDAISPAHDTTLSTLHTQAEFCGMCHDVYHPTNGIPLEQTYTEWKNGPYAAKNVQCQHCMMGEMRDTQAADSGPKRKVVFAHFFAGGNFIKGNKDEALKRLKSAATVKLVTDKGNAKPGDAVRIDVTVTNSGAGHKIPTGLTETRDMRLVIMAISATGEQTKVFEEKFGTVMEDAAGKHDGTVPVWRAVKIFSDNRLAPKETRVYNETFTIPKGAKASYRFAAALKYSPANQESTDAISMKRLPYTVMASAAQTIVLPGKLPVAPVKSTRSVPWFVWVGIAAVIVIFVAGSWMIRRKSEA